MHGPSHHTAVSAVRVLAVVPLLIAFAGPPALAGEVEVRDAEELETVLADPDPYLLERLADLRKAGPEAGIRDLYETYERTAEQSGHDLDLRLSSFETIGIDEFSRYRWLDLMTLSTGMHIVQVRNYYEAPWLDEKHVYYDLYWEPRHANSERIAQWYLAGSRSVTIAEVVAELVEERATSAVPLAVTTYRVDVSLAGRSRTYRAVAMWYDGENGDFISQIDDRVVNRVTNVVDETAVVVSKEEFDNLGFSESEANNARNRTRATPCDQ